MSVRFPRHPEVPAPDELATRALLVATHRALGMLVKALGCYLDQTRVPARHETPQNGPQRP